MKTKAKAFSFNPFCIEVLCLALFVFFFGFSAQDFDDSEGCLHNKKAEAVKLYGNARKSYERAEARGADKDAYLAIEKQLMKAIDIIPKDSENLQYQIVEKRILPGTGRWVEYYNVSIPYNRQYYPNRLLSELRGKYPPRPWVVINKVVSAEGEKFLFDIANRGKTSLEYFRICLNSDLQHKAQTHEINQIHPDTSVLVEVPFRVSGPFCVSFKEKYNYVPWDKNFDPAN